MASLSPVLFTLAAAGPLAEVRVADADGDGVQELLLVAHAGEGRVLEQVGLSASGEEGRRRRPLPAGPAWWDAGHGLWALDGRGLVDLDADRVVFAAQTALPPLSDGDPAQAWLVVDLEDDGRPELLLHTADALVVVTPDGDERGRAPAPARVVLERQQHAGGQRLATTTTPPAVAVDDVDGDGVDDLLLLEERACSAWALRGDGLQRIGRFPLPGPLLPPPPGDDARTWTTAATWADLTGDGRTDLLVHRLRGGQGLADTESEVLLYTGRGGAGLSAPQAVASRAGAQDAFVVDLDGDGDGDVLVPRLRLDAGNVAQAVFSRTVDVELSALFMDDGRLGEPVVLHQVAMPVDGGAAGSAWSLFEDLDGDGLPDLATLVDGQLSVFRGLGRRVEKRPVAQLAVDTPVEHLWAADLTGDGAPELIAWKPGARQLAVVRLR